MKHTFNILMALAFTLLSISPALSQSEGVPWPAIDSLGRQVETSTKVGAVRPDKKVGIFYFVWLQESIKKAHWTDGPYDVSKILERLPEGEKRDIETSKSDLWAPRHSTMYFWGEPLFGYYLSKDPWVIRKHVELLSDAGVDFWIFDTTNAVTYPTEITAICQTLLQMKKEGASVPQVACMLNTDVNGTANRLWNELYNVPEYQELLFQLDGKPLLIGDPEQIENETIKNALTLRRAHWPFQMVNTEKAWHWEAAYPQPYGWSTDPNHAEQVNVSVAQNLSREPSAVVQNMSSGIARGRSFHNGVVEETIDTDLGHNFQEQWQRAYELDPDVVMVTGWNEWVAGRWERGDRNVFVDQYNREYSRDIEPMRGGHLDAYYLQMVQGIRRYKGVPAVPKATTNVTIDLTAGFQQWEKVETTFTDYVNDTTARDFNGAGQTHYRNVSGRNDIVLCKAARDAENFYFYLKTAKPITPERPNGLCLLINTDNNLETGFIGGDILIGAQYNGSTALVAAHNGTDSSEWKWKKTSKVEYALQGNQLMIKAPYDVLGINAERASFNSVSFKWLDNFGRDATVADLYTTGDVAPSSRFFYQAAE